MNRAAKASNVGMMPDTEAARDSTVSPIAVNRATQGMPQPKRAEPKPVSPRPTLYVPDPRAQASADEFENL